jgi:tRNA-binding protein
MSMATFEDFQKLDIRVGKIVEVEDFPQARKPSYKLKTDFGPEIGIKKSCAQLTQNYSPDKLNGKLVMCVINLPVMQIGPAKSEVLTLGVTDEKKECVLISPDKEVPIGSKLY